MRGLRLPRSVVAACVVFSAAVATSIVAQAQQFAPSPSQVAPPVAPAAPPTSARIVLPQVEAGATIPPGAKALNFKLNGFAIDGEFAELAEGRKALEAPLAGKRISVAQVFEFAAALQALYVNAGYPIVRVVVTPQELDKAATVKLRIVDGFILRVDGSALAENVRGPALRIVSELVGQRRLKQADLERKLLLAGDTPGLVLNAIFTAAKDSKEPGGVVLVLTGRYRPVSVSFYSDNALPAVFGTGQVVGTVSLNSLFGQGEQFTVSAAGLPDADYTTNYPTRRYLSAMASAPIGNDGLMIEGGFTKGTTTPRVNFFLFASRGDLTQGYAKLSYAALKRRNAELILSARLDATDEQLETLAFGPPIALSLDKTRVLRLGADGIVRMQDTGTFIGYGAVFSQGLNGLGARTAADATWDLPLSRFGADAVFSKMQGRFEITQSLPESFFVSLGAAGQTSFGKPLLNSEKFDIASARLLSGYTAGTFSGDTGWAVRGEFGRAFTWANPVMPAVVTPYAFAAMGERTLIDPSFLEFPLIHAKNAGFGVRFNGTTAGDNATDVSGFVELSRRDSDDFERQGWRLFVGGSVRY